MKEHQYDQLVRMIKEAPSSYLPALLTIVIEACLKKKCFVPGGIEKYIDKTLAKKW